ncbi:non-classical arabinogalactan protein 31-like [Ischnura elegans]|uniref:non-classical arabinogalactan protein 31-like n=1 Tax=Ischnura elegans TaxID=197161 RepID=UPI001ED8A7E2|nr:non-classical arabinogalactan protein 31-like [Ischnura elegans]
MPEPHPTTTPYHPNAHKYGANPLPSPLRRRLEFKARPSRSPTAKNHYPSPLIPPTPTAMLHPWKPSRARRAAPAIHPSRPRGPTTPHSSDGSSPEPSARPPEAIPHQPGHHHHLPTRFPPLPCPRSGPTKPPVPPS